MALGDRHQDDLSSEQKRPIKIPLRLKKIATLPKNNPLSTWTKKLWKVIDGSSDAGLGLNHPEQKVASLMLCLKLEISNLSLSLKKMFGQISTLDTHASPNWIKPFYGRLREVKHRRRWIWLHGSQKTNRWNSPLERSLKSKTWLNHEFMPLVFCTLVIKARAVIATQR